MSLNKSSDKWESILQSIDELSEKGLEYFNKLNLSSEKITSHINGYPSISKYVEWLIEIPKIYRLECVILYFYLIDHLIYFNKVA